MLSVQLLAWQVIGSICCEERYQEEPHSSQYQTGTEKIIYAYESKQLLVEQILFVPRPLVVSRRR